jgi:nicotinate-nucleotide adenylyltransferase
VSKRLIGVFGGSFDPVHHGHIRTIQELEEALAFDQLRLMPNYQSPLKDQPGATGEQRLAMLQLATQEQPHWIIDERELHRGGSSYMVDSLTELKQELGSEASLCLIMGVDAFAAFDHWHRWQDILELANVIVMARPQASLPEQGPVAQLMIERQLSNPEQLAKVSSGAILLQELSPVDVSATEIRQRLQAADSVNDLMPDKVWQYIREHQLYGVGV